MDDLGSALTGPADTLMLGGGNPAHIPKVEQYFRRSMVKLLKNKGEFERAIGNYDSPQGNRPFIDAVAGLLRRQFGWDVRPENIALTNGSQSAFFILLNIFSGLFKDGTNKKILFPITPEYIGYSDIGLGDDLFTALKPEIEHIDDHIFKYHIDFGRLKISSQIGAICVSRPTNPTGNVLTDSEIEKLSGLACAKDIPLIIDSAYGMPFPNMVFTEAKAFWNEHTILCMSLSKLGLPTARTGIVIARPEVINIVSQVNAVISLAPGGLGAALATDLVRTGQIITMSRDVIKPFYQKKAQRSVNMVLGLLDGVNFYIHQPQGAFFLWLWLPQLSITNVELYERLKKKGVLVVSGHYFFPGLKEDWPHKYQCIRISYAQDERTVTAGLKIITDEIKSTYNSARH